MNIEVSWDNDEKTIIQFAYAENWTWEDFHSATKISNQMISSVEQTVDVIADFSNSTSPPMGALGKFRSAMETSPENQGFVVIVGGGFFVSALVSSFSRVYKALEEQLMMADTLEEARSKIVERRG